jgi:cation-transporting ATPase 13A1
MRAMSPKPYNVWVRRDQRWQSVLSEDVLPGDLLLVERSKQEDVTLPADVVLLAGSCVVNQAMLSGESTPLVKEALDPSLDLSESFDIKSLVYQNHILYGGTRILQSLAADDVLYEQYPNLKSPHSGAVGLVVRTGFGTTQGKLVRTMVLNECAVIRITDFRRFSALSVSRPTTSNLCTLSYFCSFSQSMLR